jgi:hypothetical protein
MPDPRRRLASDLGCLLDCDLATGLTVAGTPATDNTALLNAFLATATATHPVSLVLDGPSLTTGLLINGGHTTIEGIGPDSGLFLKPGSNAHVIRNHPDMQGDPGPGHIAPTRSNFGITVRNLRINGNRGTGTTGNTNTGITYDNAGKTMLYGISLVQTTAVWLEDLILLDFTTYAVTLSNCGTVVCRNLHITTPRDRNTDGIHFNGPASDIHITDCFFQTGDDAIALNAPEGFGGPIDRVAISNCIFNHAPTCIRIYGCAYPPISYPVSDVIIANCTGVVENTPFMIGFQRSAPLDTIQFLQASNCALGASYWATLNESCGVLNFQNNTWDSPTHPGFFLWIPLAVTLSSVILSNCHIYRSSRGSAPASGLHAADAARGSVIRKLSIEGFAIENEAGQTFPPIPFLLDTSNVTIDELFIGSLDPANITALAHNFKGINRISGPGVLATGFPIPDHVMADNTPFLSADTGNPSIKLQGKVRKL